MLAVRRIKHSRCRELIKRKKRILVRISAVIVNQESSCIPNASAERSIAG
ncbi:30S ribosomal protein S17 [Candidatus Hodgkinia cicadicola]|nr:30S ribosomal protein S17 [Candidatus Hodgkinia cicadicola]